MLMHLPDLVKRHRLNIRGIVHCGAHSLEEFQVYESITDGPVLWIDGQKDKLVEAFGRLTPEQSSRHILCHAWLGPWQGQILDKFKVYVAGNSQSTSLYPPLLHRLRHPDVAFHETLVEAQMQTLPGILAGDAVIGYFEEWNFLNLDLQGMEYDVIWSSGDLLRRVDAVYTEVNVDPLYAGIRLLRDMDDLMRALGLLRVDTQMTDHGWGDALYIRKA